MDAFQVDAGLWARGEFGDADLGDRRRTRRLTAVAARMAADPSATIPGQMQGWAAAKAAYRLLGADGVTFRAVAEPHWRRTRARGPGRFLVLGDTTEIDFGIRRRVPGLGPTGNGGGYGFLLHVALVVGAADGRVEGLAGGRVHYRQPAPPGETTGARLKRDRESDLWGAVIDQVGPPASGGQWVHVLDRGADNFDVYCHCRAVRADWVVRASMLHRKVADAAGTVAPLRDIADALPEAARVTLELRTRPGRPARLARLAVRYSRVTVPVPRHKSRYVRQTGAGPVGAWVVVVAEVGAPPGVRPIDWVLYTSLPVTSAEEAVAVAGYYEKRWLVEEYFKALKSGCRVAQRQLKTGPRLEAVVGVLSVVAVRLLQLKSHARVEPARAASDIVPPGYASLLAGARSLPPPADMSVGRFYRELAVLGGFLGRAGDGDPGWITIWRGWERLQWMMQGVHTANVQAPAQPGSG